MITYRCKCGYSESWSSMGQTPCRRCSKCGSNLASGSGLHGDPVPHVIVRYKLTADEGEAFLVECLRCHDKKKRIEERGESWEWHPDDAPKEG